MPFPLQTNIAKQKEEKPKQQQFSYIKMTIFFEYDFFND